jgi:hypothetical protein
MEQYLTFSAMLCMLRNIAPAAQYCTCGVILHLRRNIAHAEQY